ncbi:MAG: hypothetical protein Q8941_01220 [Bacteroidota bacterium]|nr:hypothetical protein [Bacteroidota bacterium]
MKEKESSEFPWLFLFFVTASSFFAFSGFLKLINDSPEHITLFFRIGLIASGACIIAFICGLSAKILIRVNDDYSSPND